MDDTYTDDADIYCTLESYIRCTRCGNTSKVKTLLSAPGHRFPRPDKDGDVWKDVHYYCYCDDTFAKAYDPGDGTDVVLGKNVELVELVQSVRTQ